MAYDVDSASVPSRGPLSPFFRCEWSELLKAANALFLHVAYRAFSSLRSAEEKWGMALRRREGEEEA